MLLWVTVTQESAMVAKEVEKGSKRTAKSESQRVGVQPASLDEPPTICFLLAVGGVNLVMDLWRLVSTSVNDVSDLKGFPFCFNGDTW